MSANGSTPAASRTPVPIPDDISLISDTMSSANSILSLIYMERFSAIFRIAATISAGSMRTV
ncbi:MAG: hypothetical protein H6R41_1542 [Deltaproteobacteria bacterium]|nr:hypothetical protein [Deltaproteobacteria bacterium]MBS1245005.1 hypothetical protein [Deltaproteobacteria bacterium]